ncbi:MAG: glutathione S-transferase family protein [Proteobacteria bacterium]|nr:glutathione S-transferase family protein [Burkholderiales bacterium]
MNTLTLVIGNKNYSSWSLRPWLALSMTGASFEEVRIPLYESGSASRIQTYSPAGKVPVLIDGALVVWDSLAICEYLAERFPATRLWPAEVETRAAARAVSAEMHAGFGALRNEMPMNVRSSRPGLALSPAAHGDISRVLASWHALRARHRGDGRFLFGGFSIADAMYAPVVLRFRTYGVDCGPSTDYADAVLALEPMQRWVADAQAERETIDAFER